MGASQKVKLAGKIFCSAGALLSIPSERENIQWYLDACETAGREVIEQGAITSDTYNILACELTDMDTYVQNANAYFAKAGVEA